MIHDRSRPPVNRFCNTHVPTSGSRPACACSCCSCDPPPSRHSIPVLIICTIPRAGNAISLLEVGWLITVIGVQAETLASWLPGVPASVPYHHGLPRLGFQLAPVYRASGATAGAAFCPGEGGCRPSESVWGFLVYCV